MGGEEAWATCWNHHFPCSTSIFLAHDHCQESAFLYPVFQELTSERELNFIKCCFYF